MSYQTSGEEINIYKNPRNGRKQFDSVLSNKWRRNKHFLKSQEQEKAIQNETTLQEPYKRDKYMGCPPRKILGTILEKREMTHGGKKGTAKSGKKLNASKNDK